VSSDSAPGDCGQHHVKRRRYPGPTASFAPNSKLTISTSVPHYTFPNCSIPGSSTLRSTLRCISLEQIPQYHALICLKISLFDAFPSIPSFASIDRHPKAWVKRSSIALRQLFCFDRLAHKRSRAPLFHLLDHFSRPLDWHGPALPLNPPLLHFRTYDPTS